MARKIPYDCFLLRNPAFHKKLNNPLFDVQLVVSIARLCSYAEHFGMIVGQSWSLLRFYVGIEL